MIIKGSFRIGDAAYQIEVDEKDTIEALHQAITISNPPKYCPECKNNQYFKFNARKSNSKKDGKTYTYISVHCNKCHAEATLGSHLSGGYFWKAFSKYDPNKKEEENAEEKN